MPKAAPPAARQTAGSSHVAWGSRRCLGQALMTRLATRHPASRAGCATVRQQGRALLCLGVVAGWHQLLERRRAKRGQPKGRLPVCSSCRSAPHRTRNTPAGGRWGRTVKPQRCTQRFLQGAERNTAAMSHTATCNVHPYMHSSRKLMLPRGLGGTSPTIPTHLPPTRNAHIAKIPSNHTRR